jgi:tRNA threonylcarbamoyladenosine biosynthesis protein TsaE
MQKTFSQNEIPEIARDLLKNLGARSQSLGASILALSGDLGAGKTTLCQAIARELGVKENVVSPTFVIMKMYDIDPARSQSLGASRLIHIDAYRLESSSELEKLGWKEIISDSQNLILIEWPEKVQDIIPKDSHLVSLSHVEEGVRAVQINID